MGSRDLRDDDAGFAVVAWALHLRCLLAHWIGRDRAGIHPRLALPHRGSRRGDGRAPWTS